MKNICFYFQVHQPFRMVRYPVFDIGKKHDYFDEKKNEEVMQKVAKKCYLPANKLMLDLIKNTNGKFRVAYSITGMALEQFEKYAPEVLQSFKQLAKTGAVEFLAETYSHSLAFLYSKEEFKEQVMLHSKAIEKNFGVKPTVFRNTELIYNNEVAKTAEEMGFSAVLAEGWDSVLGWRSPNYVYRPSGTKNTRLLLKNYKLSDDIAFRFSNKDWEEWPLDVNKFVTWLNKNEGETINLFMDYETFGEHQWEDTGIFKFMEELPEAVMKSNIGFKLPSEVAETIPVADLDVPKFISWADLERDLSAWTGNKMQQAALASAYALEKEVKESGDWKLLDDWRKLLTSDHFYYMCIKYFSDGDVHKYFNPYDSPYDAYINFMNIMNDIQIRLRQKPKMVQKKGFFEKIKSKIKRR